MPTRRARLGSESPVLGNDRIRLRQILREAEGYLELKMPLQALETLSRVDSLSPHQSQTLYLRGESLRALERYEEALVPLIEASELAPSNVHVWLALGWCYKRTGQLDLAIQSLEQAREAAPRESLIQYNLACYMSLAGRKNRALEYLARALGMDSRYRELIGDEPDFDPLRSDPDFQALTSIIV